MIPRNKNSGSGAAGGGCAPATAEALTIGIPYLTLKRMLCLGAGGKKVVPALISGTADGQLVLAGALRKDIYITVRGQGRTDNVIILGGYEMGWSRPSERAKAAVISTVFSEGEED